MSVHKEWTDAKHVGVRVYTAEAAAETFGGDLDFGTYVLSIATGNGDGIAINIEKSTDFDRLIRQLTVARDAISRRESESV